MGTFPARAKQAQRGGRGARPTPPGKIKGFWVLRSLDMLESPSWLALPCPARKVLEGIEVAFMRQRLKGNGEIVCTYDDHQRRGVRRASVREALDQLEALGWIEVTERGHRAATDLNFPSRYRLTYVRGMDDQEPTDEWRAIDSQVKARRALASVKKGIEARREDRRAKRKSTAQRKLSENRS